MKAQKKETLIDNMTPEQVLNELKEKKLPTFSTAQERKERLKKQYGITTVKQKPTNVAAQSTYGNHSNSVVEVMSQSNGFTRKPTTNDKIEQIKFNRDQRRIKMEEARKLKSEREANNELQGIKVDVDFQAMVEQERKRCAAKKAHT